MRKSFNPWKTIKKNIIYKNKFGYRLRDDDVITPAGKKGKYMVMEGRDSVLIVPITGDGKLVMVRQWRYAVEKEFLEIPAGGIDGGDSALNAAKIELKEEVGGTGKRWTKLTEYWVGNGALRCKSHVFLVQDVVLGKSHPEETEKLTREIVDFDKAVEMVLKGEIDDEKTITGILLAEKYLERVKVK